MKLLTKIFSIGLLMSPVYVFAQTSVNFSWANSLVNAISYLVELLIPLAIGIGLLFFIWGLVQYIAASGDDGAKQEGKNKMIWGVIALFVIVSVWGIIALLGNLLNITDNTTPNAPGVPGATTVDP